jgi:hypothetical protein
MKNNKSKLFLLIFQMLFVNAHAQIFGFFPKVDTLFTGGGCTGTMIVATYVKALNHPDTLKIFPGWNTTFYSGKTNYFDQVYFLIQNPANRYEVELWVEPSRHAAIELTHVPLDSEIYLGFGEYNFKLILKDQGVKTDSLTQFCFSQIVGAVDPEKIGGVNEFQFYPNFPNPFNQETTINYRIPKKTAVKLFIYNLTGQLVTVLVDEILTPGYYSTKWNAGSAGSGQYFMVLKTGSRIETRKCILLK